MKIKLTVIGVILAILAGCSTGDVVYKYPKNKEEREIAEVGSVITGDETQIEFVNGKNIEKSKDLSNTHVWKAALEVISFMPIASSDAVGGAIITDWYSDEKTPNERFKFNIIINSNKLEATTLKIKGFKEVRRAGNWQTVKMNESVTKDLETKILTKARQMKISNF